MTENTKIFITKNSAEWQSRINQNWNTIVDCEVSEYPNAYVLPLKSFYLSKDSPNKLFQGGVLSEQKQFVAGHTRRLNGKLGTLGLECMEGYTLDGGGKIL